MNNEEQSSTPPDPINVPSSDSNQTPPSAITEPVIPAVASVSQDFGSQDKAVDNSRSAQLKSLLIKIMLACLIAAASVAVLAILAGSMGDVAWKAINTIISAIIHIGILFAVLSMTSDRNPLLQKSNDFVVNTSIVITILSFFTSIFAMWDIMTGALPFRLYATYALVLFMVLHAKTLIDVEVVYNKVKPYVYANYAFMVLVAILILGLVYVDNSWGMLDGFYGRLLGASAIVDVTLSMVIAVMHRLYTQKHPELKQQEQAHHSSPTGKIVVALLLFVFFVWPLISMVMAFSRFGSGY
ncbi:MAG: hypothetical protein WAT17_04225 [Candidatus Saccharimonadales bacterium]|jgi:hypothetical protein